MTTWQSLITVQDVRIKAARRVLQQSQQDCARFRDACAALEAECTQLGQQRVALQQGFVTDKPRNIAACSGFTAQLAGIDQRLQEQRQCLTAEKAQLQSAEQRCQKELRELTRLRARREVLALQDQLSRQALAQRREQRAENALTEQLSAGYVRRRMGTAW